MMWMPRRWLTGWPATVATLALTAVGCTSKNADTPLDSVESTNTDSDTVWDSGAHTDSGAEADSGDVPDSDVHTDSSGDSATDSGAAPDMPFVEVPASTFDMGDTPGQPDDGTIYGVHTITLTHAYLLGVTEVTQAQFEAVMGYNPSRFTDCDGSGPDDCPVEYVDWFEAAAFANGMSLEAGLEECYACMGSGDEVECDVSLGPYDCTGYRLPTEAEWEGAARCGTDMAYAGSDDPDDVAWTLDNEDNYSTHMVALLAPNGCGTYDMSGNDFEWVQDWYADYPAGGATDPVGPTSGTHRGLRGGNFASNAIAASVSPRESYQPWEGAYTVSFRLARTEP
ncbi:MAG: hypothetical protein EXR69_10190 [Myxococcales bacterium]|nr:hypothetical protein [Myxococcales bacterium]